MVSQHIKATDIGTIPCDWDCVSVGTIADIKTGPFGSLLHAKDYVITGIPIITVEHLSDFGVKHSNLPLVSRKDYSRLANYQLHVGDIVFSRVGAVDRNAVIEQSEDGWLFSGRLLRLRVKKNTSSRYLSYYFHCKSTVDRIKSIAVGQTMASLNTSLFSGFKVVLPSYYEQKAIADALYDIDCLIETTQKLIAKKESIKYGIIQELFSKYTNTKESELGSIPETWDIFRVKDVFRLLQTNTFPRSVMNNERGVLQNIHYGDILTIYGAIIDCDRDCIPYFNPGVFIRDDLKLHSGDIIIADTAEDNTVGKAAEIINVGPRKIFAGLHTILLRPKNDRFVHGFLGLFFNTELFHTQLLPFVTGTKVSSISKESIKNLLVLCPPKNEQKEIVRIVCDSDKEISELKKYLVKLQGIKAGMMTELLTGRIRLTKDLSHDEQIDDAVMISAIVNAFYSDKYPLGRKKVQKLLYLARRHQNTTPTGFLKKAAGPYKPSARYSGGEKIAAKNGYITIAESSQGARFSVGSKIAKAIDYAEQWGYLPVINWLVENFKYTKVDELEVLATVDMAICDLKSAGQNCSVSEIKALINQNSEWRQKLQKPYFSDRNIDIAIKKLNTFLFNDISCNN